MRGRLGDGRTAKSSCRVGHRFSSPNTRHPSPTKKQPRRDWPPHDPPRLGAGRIDAPQRTRPCCPVPSAARVTGVPRDSPAVGCRFRWGAGAATGLLGTVRTLYTNTRRLSSPSRRLDRVGGRRMLGRKAGQLWIYSSATRTWPNWTSTGASPQPGRDASISGICASGATCRRSTWANSTRSSSSCARPTTRRGPTASSPRSSAWRISPPPSSAGSASRTPTAPKTPGKRRESSPSPPSRPTRPSCPRRSSHSGPCLPW